MNGEGELVCRLLGVSGVFVGGRDRNVSLLTAQTLTTQQLGKQSGGDALCSVFDGGQVEERVWEVEDGGFWEGGNSILNVDVLKWI